MLDHVQEKKHAGHHRRKRQKPLAYDEVTVGDAEGRPRTRTIGKKWLRDPVDVGDGARAGREDRKDGGGQA